jgi:hypothetical protein
MKKSLIVISIAALLVIMFLWVGSNMAPGSYVYAEEYELPYSEIDVKAAIAAVKEDHPELRVPKVSINGSAPFVLQDEQTKDSELWYKVYFYYPKDDKIILTLLRPSGKDKSKLSVVSVNDGLELGNWKQINKDFDDDVNRQLKEEFKIQILDPLERKLKK